MAWEINGTPNTLTGAAVDITIADLTPLTYNVFLNHNIYTTLFPQPELQLGTGSVDTGANYNQRISVNGGADQATATPKTSIRLESATDTNSDFSIGYIINVVNEEKLVIAFNVAGNTVGAASAPTRQDTVGKWVTLTQYDNINITNTNSGEYAVDSNLSALGTD